jgi:hypothetical protein
MILSSGSTFELIDDVYYDLYISSHRLESVLLNQYVRNKIYLKLWSVLNNKLTYVSSQEYI